MKTKSVLPKLITPEEAAKFLGLSTITLAVWRCRKRYNLQYYKIGRLVRYTENDLLEFILSRKRGGDLHKERK